MESNSVFVKYWTTKHYLTHPWKFFRDLIRNLKKAKDRALKGYCSTDWSCFTDWFCSVIPNMLNDFAEKAWGYPGQGEFDSFEKWSAYLQRIANQLRQVGEDPDKENEYAEEFWGPSEDLNYVPSRSLITKYADRQKEIQETKKELLRKILNEMVDNWWSMYD